MGGMEDFFNQGRRVKTQAEPEAEKQVEQKPEPTPVRTKSNIASHSPSRPIQEESRLSPANSRKKELEERKRYPERTFDKYVQKGARLRSDDLDLLRVFCSEITRAKREMPYEYRVNKRITDNTILRLLVHSFCEKVEEQLDHIDFKGIQTEEELKNFIEETMKF